MFDSGISAKNLIEEVISEADIALEIPTTTYVMWLNALQQMLYTEIIKEQKKYVLRPISNPIDISTIEIGENENQPRFEDIHTIYADGVQLIKSTLTSGVIFPDTFYKNNNNIGYNTEYTPSEMTIVYYVKPALITTTTHGNVNDVNVMLPIEFIDLAKAKLRGEAYKLANEDSIAAKWLNDYNILLETFKAWILEKSSDFGM